MTKAKNAISETDTAEIGQNLFYGIGVRKNYRKAFPLLLEAAEAGHIHCMNLVGFCYDGGLGVAKDRAMRCHGMREAAERGHQVAMYNLAITSSFGPRG